MNVYFISYDLIKDKDYKKLIDKIKSYKNHMKVHKSVWLIATSKELKDLYDDIESTIDPDDKLYVACKAKGSFSTSDNYDVRMWTGRMHNA